MAYYVEKYFLDGKIKEKGIINNGNREGEWVIGDYLNKNCVLGGNYYLTKMYYINGILNGYYK